nr:MAG TPA: hypothetical protein [Caudoviricetes sp.]
MSASKFHLNVSIARRVRAFCCPRSAQASDFRPHHAGFFIARRQL